MDITVKIRAEILIYEKITTSAHFTHECLHYTASNSECFIDNTGISKLLDAQAILQSRHHTVKN